MRISPSHVSRCYAVVRLWIAEGAGRYLRVKCRSVPRCNNFSRSLWLWAQEKLLRVRSSFSAALERRAS
jgi:hypothetical protein